jgi:hypothetical protein
MSMNYKSGGYEMQSCKLARTFRFSTFAHFRQPPSPPEEKQERHLARSRMPVLFIITIIITTTHRH